MFAQEISAVLSNIACCSDLRSVLPIQRAGPCSFHWCCKRCGVGCGVWRVVCADPVCALTWSLDTETAEHLRISRVVPLWCLMSNASSSSDVHTRSSASDVECKMAQCCNHTYTKGDRKGATHKRCTAKALAISVRALFELVRSVFTPNAFVPCSRCE